MTMSFTKQNVLETFITPTSRSCCHRPSEASKSCAWRCLCHGNRHGWSQKGKPKPNLGSLLFGGRQSHSFIATLAYFRIREYVLSWFLFVSWLRVNTLEISGTICTQPLIRVLLSQGILSNGASAKCSIDSPINFTASRWSFCWPERNVSLCSSQPKIRR